VATLAAPSTTEAGKDVMSEKTKKDILKPRKKRRKSKQPKRPSKQAAKKG
jgi:hypothetical protein